MNLIKKITAAAFFSLLSVSPLAAQFHLPAPHADQHDNLIANQRAVGMNTDKLKIEAINASKKHQVVADKEIADLFNYNWSDQSVAGGFDGLTIPSTKNIDVRGYVAPVPGQLTSPYGYRPRFGRMHKGVDLNLHTGDTVRCAFDGRVRITKYEGKGYGYYVVVRHDNGLETVYGHLSRFLVKPNQYVKAGEPLALGGSTGRSTGPHLHFETRFMGLAINPEAIIDFTNGVTHTDVFTFDKASYDRAMNAGQAKAAKAKSKKSRRGKATASSKKKKSRRK